MRILALETAVQPGSVALLENTRIVSQFGLAADVRTTRSIIPAIAAQLAAFGWKATELDLVAVSQGPGSFTGLRVGITVAKTLAYATGAAVLGIDTLEAIARQSKPAEFPSETRALWAIMDAQRQQLFCARFDRGERDDWRLAQSPHVLGIDQWLEKTQAGEVVAGPPVEKLRSRINPQAIFAEAENFAPRAATVGELAAEAFQRGRRDDVWALVPKYYRISAAEEKRAAGSAGR